MKELIKSFLASLFPSGRLAAGLFVAGFALCIAKVDDVLLWQIFIVGFCSSLIATFVFAFSGKSDLLNELWVTGLAPTLGILAAAAERQWGLVGSIPAIVACLWIGGTGFGYQWPTKPLAKAVLQGVLLFSAAVWLAFVSLNTEYEAIRRFVSLEWQNLAVWLAAIAHIALALVVAGVLIWQKAKYSRILLWVALASAPACLHLTVQFEAESLFAPVLQWLADVFLAVPPLLIGGYAIMVYREAKAAAPMAEA